MQTLHGRVEAGETPVIGQDVPIISPDAIARLREVAPDRVYLYAEGIVQSFEWTVSTDAPDGYDWTKGHHRTPPLPHYRLKPEKGRCRICGTTEEGLKGTWHKQCVSAWDFYSKPHTELLGYLQDFLCAGCGDAIGYARRHEIGRSFPERPKRGAKAVVTWSDWSFVLSGRPEADHIVPLYRVRRDLSHLGWKHLLRYWTPQNMQALCYECHLRKCAAEAAERAAFAKKDWAVGTLFDGEPVR